jgi:HK97 family phage portal protein
MPTPVVYWQQSVDVGLLVDGMLQQPIERLWREQPHLRTVVGFIARNIAHLGLHAFERDAADGRNRLREGPLVQLLEQPNPQTTLYELIYATAASMCLYDVSYWYVGEDNNAVSGWVIRHLPTPWVIGTVGASAFAIDAYKVALPNNNGQWVEIPSKQIIEFHGWSPNDPKIGSSPVHALKSILAEQVHAQVFRDQMWRNGGRVGQYLTRPADAGDWGRGENGKPSARERFIEQWQEFAGDKGPKAGRTPLLEDGMELKSSRFSAKDEQYVEGNKLSLETVAQVYHINPTMVGLLDNANYSNVREFRRMLYGDTLGPYLAQFEQRINTRLVRRVAARPDATYVEFNLNAKLAGSFEEQGAVLQTAVGGPWMTRNEARAKQNMPAIEGGDELILPLNLGQNGDQNPTPAAPPNEPDDPTEGEKHRGTRKFNGVHVRI